MTMASGPSNRCCMDVHTDPMVGDEPMAVSNSSPVPFGRVSDWEVFSLAAAGPLGSNVAGLYHLMWDDAKDTTLTTQIGRAFAEGKYPAWEQLPDLAMSLWRRPVGALLQDSEVQHRSDGGQFVLFGRANLFWPPPLALAFGREYAKNASDSWEVTFSPAPSWKGLRKHVASCNWVGATWFRQCAYGSDDNQFVADRSLC